MTERFRASCSTCGYESAPRPAYTGLVLVTDAEEDRRRRTEHVPLVFHPLAVFVLDEFGLTYPAAAWGGQLVVARSVVCPVCGTCHEYRHLTGGGASVGCGGWLYATGLGVAVAAATAWLAESPFVGLAVGGGVTVGILASAELCSGFIIRCLYPRRAAALAASSACPRCGHPDGVRLSDVPAGLPCPQCGEPHLTVGRA